MRRSIGLLAVIALGACGERASPPEAAVGAPAAGGSAEPATPPPAAASATPAQSSVDALKLPPRFAALGTEPFWHARVDGGRLTYTTPDDQAGRTIAVTRSAAGGTVEYTGTIGAQALTLSITAGPCSDGMSDTVYPFTVTRRLGEDTQRGCARPE